MHVCAFFYMPQLSEMPQLRASETHYAFTGHGITFYFILLIVYFKNIYGRERNKLVR